MFSEAAQGHSGAMIEVWLEDGTYNVVAVRSGTGVRELRSGVAGVRAARVYNRDAFGAWAVTEVWLQ